jgi:hypothetical protein
VTHGDCDGAGDQSGHDQQGVADDRGAEPDLGLVQAEAVFDGGHCSAPASAARRSRLKVSDGPSGNWEYWKASSPDRKSREIKRQRCG